MSTNDTPSQIDARHFKIPKENDLEIEFPSAHKPRILLLYGSLRERSFSRFLTLEADRLLKAMGADTRISIQEGYRFPTVHQAQTRKFKSFAICAVGQRRRSGALPNGMEL